MLKGTKRIRICQRCQKRYGYLFCQQCKYQRLCTTCSENIHSNYINRNHTITIIENSEKRTKTELVESDINLDFEKAIATAKRIQNIHDPTFQKARLLRLQELENEKRLQEEIRKNEEHMNQLALLQSKLTEKGHSAAKKLQSHFRSVIKWRKMIDHLHELRNNIELGQATSLRAQRQEIAATKIQKSFRMYSIHVFLKRNELILQNRNNPLTHRKWTIEEMDLVEERVNNDFHKRRIAERICMNNTCRKSHILLKLIIKSELSKLKKKRIYTQRIHNKLTTRIVHQSEKIKDTCQNQSSSNNRNLMKDLEIQKIKKKHGSYIAQIHLRSSHYIQDYFRVLLRILQMSLILSQESCNFLHDLGTNAKSMRKTLSFVEGKLNAVEVIDRNNYYKEWMEFQHKHFVSCLTNSDCDQELILSNEVMRINEEIKLVYSIRKVFEEYWVASYALCSYVAEGIAPNVEVIVNEGEPEVNLIQLHRIKFLNAKQKTIRESILPKIQKQLDKLYQIAERRTDFPAMKVLDLKIDFEPDLEFDTMLEHLNSVSNDKKDSVLLFLHEEWMDLFLSQPWVAKERAEESRLHQARNMERRMLQNKEKELEKRKFRLKYDHQQAVFTKDLMEELKREEAKADKSKFKRKELHNAYSTLENILNEFEKNSKHRSDSIRKEEHDAQTRLRHLKNEENSSRTRRGILQKAIYEFEVKELNHEKEYIKKLDVEESILREEALEIQNLIQIGITPKSTKDMRKGQNPNIGQLSSFMNNIKSGKNVSLNTMSADLLKRYELYNARKQTLVSERQKCDERHKKRLDLLKKTKIETEIQIYKENLRALQQEIQLRKERLSSITTTQENSEKGTFFEENIMWLSKGELKKIRSLINNNDRIQRDYSGIFDIADLTRKTGTSFVRQLRNIRNKENENIEEKQMMTIVRRRMSMQERKVKGISQIMFTVGKRETGDFAVENHELQIKGLPYFHRLKKEIGIQEQIVIWMKSTTLQKEFITDVKLGNTIFGHPEYKNLTSEGYELVEHNCMKGEHMKDPSLHLWYKKDLFSINFICDLNVSYSIKEEEDLQKEEFERVNISLSNFGLGNNFLWTRKEDRSAKITLTDSTHMTAQLEEYTNMQTKNPDDPILQDMVEKMRRRLHAVQLKEENDLLDLKDDVKYIVDFLSLRKDDLKKFEKVYLKIDKDNDGFISLDEFRLFIDKNAESLKTFSNHIFTVSIGNPPEDDKLEFGSTIKSVSMFCLLTRDEILKFIFSIFDGKGFGSITNEAFMQILSMMHPKHHGRAIRALHEFDLPKTGKMSFAEFDSLQSRFPNLLYPALRYQELIRMKFIGIPFWERKLRKFMMAKNRVKSELSMVEESLQKEQGKDSVMQIKTKESNILAEGGGKHVLKKNRQGRRMNQSILRKIKQQTESFVGSFRK